jgi:hypothetical protein
LRDSVAVFFHHSRIFQAKAIRGKAAFEKVYLLNALQPGLEAFEIYPACARCN